MTRLFSVLVFFFVWSVSAIAETCPAGVLCITIIGSASSPTQSCLGEGCANVPTGSGVISDAPWGVSTGSSADRIEVNNGTGEIERVATTTDAAKAPQPPAAASTAQITTLYQAGISSTCAGDSPSTKYSSKAQACVVLAEGIRYAQNNNAGGNCLNPVFVSSSGVIDENGYCDVTLSKADSTTVFYSNLSISSIQECPPGYTNISNVCSLSDARAAVADSNQDFTRSGTTLSTASASDADTSVFLDNDSIGKIVGGSYQRAGVSVTGKPAHVEIKPTADGGSLVVYTESLNGVINQTTYAVGSNGKISSVSGSTALGNLSTDALSGTASVSAPGAVSLPGTGGTGGTGAGLQQPTFPSDYSKFGEAGIAAKSITDKLDEKLGSGADPTDPTVPDGTQFDQAFFQGTFTNLLGWSLPGHTSTCPTGSFDWNGQTFTMNSHCQLIQDHFGAFSMVMAVVWSIVALFVVLAA